jgi:hypothetical protein
VRNLAFFAASLLVVAFAVHAGVTTISESKQPWEEIQGTVDFSSRLMAGDNVHVQNCTATGIDPWDNVVTDSIVSLDNAVVTDNTFADNVFMDNTARYTRKGGSDGNTYKITIRCTSDNGAKLEQDIIFKVQEF